MGQEALPDAIVDLTVWTKRLGDDIWAEVLHNHQVYLDTSHPGGYLDC